MGRSMQATSCTASIPRNGRARSCARFMSGPMIRTGMCDAAVVRGPGTGPRSCNRTSCSPTTDGGWTMIADGLWRAEDTPLVPFKGKRRLPRVPYDVVLRLSRTLDRLRAFDPHVVGALPLGLAVADSDIRVVCHAPDTGRFAQAVSTYFHDARGFRLTLW